MHMFFCIINIPSGWCKRDEWCVSSPEHDVATLDFTICAADHKLNQDNSEHVIDASISLNNGENITDTTFNLTIDRCVDLHF